MGDKDKGKRGKERDREINGSGKEGEGWEKKGEGRKEEEGEKWLFPGCHWCQASVFPLVLHPL